MGREHRTQVWLAVSDEPAAKVTGKYFRHKQLRTPHPAAHDTDIQDALIEACGRLSGIELAKVDVNLERGA